MYTGAKEELLCDQCIKRKGRFSCDRGFSLCIYDDVMRKLIYRFKYAGRREYGDALGHLMGRRYKKMIERAGVDGIVPVPLHEKRFKKRGYNQSELLAKGISEICDVPYYPDYVLRVKNTAPMKTLSGKMRQNNLKKAFKIGQNDVKLKKVVVVDDIYTTGSTVEAVAHVLKEAGVKKVYFLTLSTGDGK